MPFTHSPGIRSMPVHYSVKIASMSNEKKANYKRLSNEHRGHIYRPMLQYGEIQC